MVARSELRPPAASGRLAGPSRRPQVMDCERAPSSWTAAKLAAASHSAGANSGRAEQTEEREGPHRRAHRQMDVQPRRVGPFLASWAPRS